ncbi:hypothetical protein SAMN05421872_102308 [Nocardioides lianchengensis]|uniref:Uncharacterized protein n=2 Tax=Nocardioides lianchengensis TaxID=1045774 RepID=A0A1G6LN55_9ACTN|nr:hypothetical protein SAMN05421872_102308 [Nocardioides lianchengensis]
MADRPPADTSPEFRLWKPIGDELVFTVDLESEVDVYNAVRIWLRAIDVWNDRIAPLGMGTKGGAFIATFPYPDRAVAVPRNTVGLGSDKNPIAANDELCDGPPDHENYLYDYFGPSIDTGFRLFAQASPRRFPMSVEVVLAVLRATPDAYNDLEYHGGRELKGVWEQRDYPFFTVDRRNDDKVNEAVKSLRNDKGMKGPAEAIALCESCIDADKWPSRLYLSQGATAAIREAPTDHLDGYKDPNAMHGSETADAAQGSEESLDEGPLPPDAPLG